MPPRLAALILAAIVVFLLAVTAYPYINAAVAAGDGYQFGGFLLNPMDGNSYLAKMRLGWQGDWQFTLPYTAEVGQGSYLFLFYLCLGHLSRWLNLPLIGTFHLARLLAATFMFATIYYFYRALFPEVRQTVLAFILAMIGSGMGWVGLLMSQFSSDFWVAEAYPFLSAYANPHFPLGLGLLLLIFIPPALQATPSPDLRRGRLASILYLPWVTGLISLLLAIITPFGVVIALSVFAGCMLLAFLQPREGFSPRQYLMRLVWVGFGGVPVLAYDLWVTTQDQLLHSWNAQNLTPSPQLWDLALSFSPLLFLAALGAGWLVLRDRRGQSTWGNGWRLPFVWIVLALIIMYLPLSLQRRFIMGLYVPLAVFAVAAISWFSAGRRSRFSILAVLLIILVIPTNLLVLLSARYGVQTRDPQIYLSRAEAQAIAWLEAQAEQDSLVLASPSTGLFIPAHSGRRVIYGHPFETANAAEEKRAVENFFSNSSAESQDTFLQERGVDYLFYGPRERQLGLLGDLDDLKQVFQAGDVVIYAVPENSNP